MKTKKLISKAVVGLQVELTFQEQVILKSLIVTLQNSIKDEYSRPHLTKEVVNKTIIFLDKLVGETQSLQEAEDDLFSIKSIIS